MPQSISDHALILLQLGIFVTTSIGFGHWISKICTWRAKPDQTHWFLSTVSGFCLMVVLLQNLVYLNQPLHKTAWAILLIALAGCVQQCREIIRVRNDGVPWYRHDKNRAAGLVFIVVFLIQGGGLFHHGPHHYYGNGHTDQVNYALHTQFLMDEVQSRDYDTIGLSPWLVLGIDSKHARNGQGIANGYVSTISWTDAKAGYGSTSIFLVALFAASMTILSASFGLGTGYAVLVGVWCGILPAMTKIHLDGFFSQTASLFVFPCLAFALRTPSVSMRSATVYSGLLLAYLFAAYTEIFPVAVASIIIQRLLQTSKPLKERVLWTAASFLIAAVIEAYYLPHAIRYLLVQQAASVDAPALSVLFPHGGTLQGWADVFVEFMPSVVGDAVKPSETVGIVLFGLCICGLWSVPSRRRIELLAIVLAPLFFLATLTIRSHFVTYPFAKLLATFCGYWVMLVVFGVLRLLRSPQLKVSFHWHRNLAVATIVVLLLFSGYGTQRYLDRVRENHDILEVINSPIAKASYAYLESHPQQTYLVDELHPILARWFIYHGRRAQMYLAQDFVFKPRATDEVLPFRCIDELPTNVNIVDHTGVTNPRQFASRPTLHVVNPNGVDLINGEKCYWVGNTIQLNSHLVGLPVDGQQYALRFQASAGPSSRAAKRTIAIIEPDGAEQAVTFEGKQEISALVRLHNGNNEITIKVIEPTQADVQVPGDNRLLMVRVESVTMQNQQR